MCPGYLQFSGGDTNPLWCERLHEGKGRGGQLGDRICRGLGGAGKTSVRRAGWAEVSWESVKETGGGKAKHQR